MTLKNINKKYKRILGLDTSSNSIAFALIEGGELVKYGEVVFKGKTPEERLVDASSKVLALRSELKADLVVIEGNIQVRNKSTGLMLGWYVGVCAGLLSQGRPIRTLKPLEWQAAIGNKLLSKQEKDDIKKAYPNKSVSWYTAKNRETRKDKTRWWVEKTFGPQIESDNVTDAIAITHISYQKWGQK